MSSAPGSSDSSVSSNAERHYAESRYRDPRSRSAFAPILTLGLAVLVWSGFQTIMLVYESGTLAKARDSQEVQIKGAEKLRQALDALARDTAKLADRGNPGARLLVEELRKRGVTINPEAPPPPAAAK